MPRPASLLPPVAAGALAATVAAGLLVPIYTDEVAWRFQTARAVWDGGVDRGLADQCGPNTTAAAPWFLQPLRHLSAWWQAALADPRAVRLQGIALALVALALIGLVARAAGAGRAGTALAAGLLGLGALPWLLVWSRPEQAILLALVAAILLALRPGAAPLRIGAIVLLAVAALGYHPKAVAFAPVFAVAALATGGRAERGWRVTGAAAIVAFALAAARYWRARLACPDDPLIRAKAAAESALAGGGWDGLLGNAAPAGYVAGIAARAHVMGDWLPPRPLPGWAEAAWLAPAAVGWQAAFLAAAAGIVLAARAAWRRPDDRARAGLAAAIAGCTLAWAATQANKNAYEAALVLPLAAVALLLVHRELAGRWPRPLALATRATVALALASEALLLAVYAGPLARAAAQPGTLYRQPSSFTAWGYPALRRQILAAGAACGIAPERARYLLIDPLTYWPYLRSWRPFFREAVVGEWRGTIADPIAYLAAHRSSGAVLQCAGLPPGLRARAHATGQFCCLGAPA